MAISQAELDSMAMYAQTVADERVGPMLLRLVTEVHALQVALAEQRVGLAPIPTGSSLGDAILALRSFSRRRVEVSEELERELLKIRGHTPTHEGTNGDD